MPRLTGQIKGSEESAGAKRSVPRKSALAKKASDKAAANRAADKKAADKKKPKSTPVERKVIGAKAAPKKAGAERQELVVFAFRLTEPERNVIHNAAGRGKATSFARAALAAVATGDAAAVKDLMACAAKNLKAL